MTSSAIDGYMARLVELGRAGAESSLDERAWLLEVIRYHAYAEALGVINSGRSAAETIDLAQGLVSLAATVGDPMGVGPVAAAFLEMAQGAGRKENDAEFRASIPAFTAIAVSEGASEGSASLLRERLAGLEECARVNSSCKTAFAEIAEIESRQERHEHMTPAERMSLQADIDQLERRLQREERSWRSWVGVKAPHRAAFRRWRRPARRAARRGARRCSARRATYDAGGAANSDGDGPGGGDGPRPKRSLLRACGVASVRGPGGRGIKPRPHARGSEPPGSGLRVACGRGPYPSAARVFAALWRRRFQGPPRGPVRAADGGGQHGTA
jgi:hypothetical protein